MTLSEVDLFKALFTGGQDAEVNQNGVKKRIKFLTLCEYDNHLMGDEELYLKIDNDGRQMFSVIDNVSDESVSMLINMRAPVYIFSKGKENRAFLFFKSWTDSKTALEYMSFLAHTVNTTNSTFKEYVRLPFFNACDGDIGKVISAEFNETLTTLFEALEYIAEHRGDFVSWRKHLKFDIAPPCVQKAFYINSTEYTPLLNCAIYFKAFSPDVWEERFSASGLTGDAQIKHKIIGYLNRVSCPYVCTTPLCNKSECLKRPYGFASKCVPSVKIGKLVQFASTPVYYRWTINDKDVEFERESDIIGQDRFRQLCLRNLGILPKRLSETTWNSVIQTALSHMYIVAQEKIAKGREQKLKDLLVNSMKNRTVISDKLDMNKLALGYICVDTMFDMTLDASAVSAYLSAHYSTVRVYSLNEFIAVLKRIGFRSSKRTVGGLTKSVWVISLSNFFSSKVAMRRYLCDVSKGTEWEDNIALFLKDSDDEDTYKDFSMEVLANTDAKIASGISDESMSKINRLASKLSEEIKRRDKVKEGQQ